MAQSRVETTLYWCLRMKVTSLSLFLSDVAGCSMKIEIWQLTSRERERERERESSAASKLSMGMSMSGDKHKSIHNQEKA